MARCAGDDCGRWRPDVLIRRGAGANIDGRWFCSRDCIERMARQLLSDVRPAVAAIPTVPPTRLGAILRHQGASTPAAIEQALEAQRGTKLRLGEQLVGMGLLEPRALLRALAAQAGVSYLATVDPRLVRRAAGGLSIHAVRALGLVPISEAAGDHIRVACPAPVPRRALGSFRQLTGWIPEVFLVSDSDWQTLIDSYGSDLEQGAVNRPIAQFVLAETVSDAAAGIATVATRERDTRVTEARWDPYTWVRVHGSDSATDVVLSHSHGSRQPAAGSQSTEDSTYSFSPQEATCRVATTSH